MIWSTNPNSSSPFVAVLWEMSDCIHARSMILARATGLRWNGEIAARRAKQEAAWRPGCRPNEMPAFLDDLVNAIRDQHQIAAFELFPRREQGARFR